MVLYEPGAAFVAEPGKVVTGLEAHQGGQGVGAFIATKPQIDIEVEQVIQSGDVALLHARYTLKGTGPDGKPTEMSGRSAEVVRWQADCSWRFIIDNPFGTG